MTEVVKVAPQVWRNPWHFLAFGFGSGLMPKAPGTWGSLVALPFIPFWQLLPDWGYWLMLGVTFEVAFGAMYGLKLAMLVSAGVSYCSL